MRASVRVTADRSVLGIAPVLAVLLCASAWGAPIRQATEAAARAVSLVGFPETAITAVEPRVVSDPMTPFWPVESRPVWEVRFEGVTGHITVDEQHNAIKSAAIMQVKDGRVQYAGAVHPR